MKKKKYSFCGGTEEKRNNLGQVISQNGKFGGGRDAGQLDKVQGGCG